MQANGVRADQVIEVRGFADQRLRKPDSPQDPSNRRISLIVQYVVQSSGEEVDNPPVRGDQKTVKSKLPTSEGKPDIKK